MDRLSWNNVLDMQVFVVNMDKCHERLQISMERIKKAGFTNVRRFKAVDGKKDNLREEWAIHGSPKIESGIENIHENNNEGKQGCTLSHLHLWKKIIDERIPYAIIFEDDIKFHKDWDTIAKMYWDSTPKHFDLLYMGSQLDIHITAHISAVPVYCTHAYMITLEGAKQLYDLQINSKKGVQMIDCFLCLLQHSIIQSKFQYQPIQWYVWNATMFVDPNAIMKSRDFTKRNSGLVFQDEVFGTYVGV